MLACCLIKPLQVETKIATAGSGSDWRSEIKKRERAKQQEKLNAMPLGMPDYREPEKGQVYCIIIFY